MDRIIESVCPQEIALELDVHSKWESLETIATLIGRSHDMSAQPILRALWRREMASSTAVGSGFAIPHARIHGIAEPVTFFARTKSPIDFAAPNGEWVSELFVILVPANGDNNRHLHMLALVAKAFTDTRFRARLARTSDSGGVRSAFQDWIEGRGNAFWSSPLFERTSVS
jgi:nitrogen PTS system EIIA component